MAKVIATDNFDRDWVGEMVVCEVQAELAGWIATSYNMRTGDWWYVVEDDDYVPHSGSKYDD